jgi:hypothetical protein
MPAQPRKPLAENFALSTERLGPLPLVSHFIERLGLTELLASVLPTTDRRCPLPHALALGVLLRSIVVEREPIYREAETVHAYAASLFGLEEPQFLPKPRILPLWPDVRFLVNHPRWKPSA